MTKARSRFSILTRKPIPLSYNEYLYSCARSLALEPGVPTDSNLIYQLELDRDAERVYDIFNYAETTPSQIMNDEQLQLYLNAFSSRIREWLIRLPSSLSEKREQTSCSFILSVITPI